MGGGLRPNFGGNRALTWSWARVIRGRLPVIGRPNADILHHGPPPAYAHGREAVSVGGAQAWPQVHPGRTASGCERRAAAVGWWVPAEPIVLRLNSQARI